MDEEQEHFHQRVYVNSAAKIERLSWEYVRLSTKPS